MQTVTLHTKAHTEPAIAAGMWIGLGVGEVLVSVEYWLARVLRHPLIALGSFSLGAASSVVVLAATHCNSQTRFATLDLKAMSDGVELYRNETGSAPARLEDLVPRYLKSLHTDPWGNNYVYYRGAGGVAIVSAGPDGVLGGGDDIVITRK